MKHLGFTMILMGLKDEDLASIGNPVMQVTGSVVK
jgi:hypothetical protein